ncbi:MAG: glycosyltransferase family 4 protein [Alphaproteobacteria bacterium]|nr:glycosyltransferase family 4 protein [Alphaproteobacteria bacterium]
MSKTLLISINSSWNIVHFRAGLLNALKGAGYRLISAAPHDDYTPKLEALVQQHIDLPMDNAGTSPFADMMLFIRYVFLLRRTRPAALLSYTVKPNIYGALAARLWGIPVIANVSGLGTAFIRNTWVTCVVKLLYRAAFARVHTVFFQNSEDRDLFIQSRLVVPEKALLLAGSGINLQHFVPSSSTATPQSFVLIARMLWDKGVGEFVEAARRVKASYPDAQFTLVGAMGAKNQSAVAHEVMDSWVAEGIITYRGMMEDVRLVMAQHACVVLPSYREGLSRVLLEASAMGRPIITTDVAGCRQVVTHGKNGLLCRAQDAASLAERMIEFLELSDVQRERMGQESRAKAEAEFDEQRVFEAYLERIRSLS